MKLAPGIVYFPRLLLEAQCPFCSKVLEWKETESKSKIKSECCNKVFTATPNYVGITIDDIQTKKEGKEED